MTKEEQILDGFKKLCAAPIQILVAIVKAVHLDTYTIDCEPIDDGVIYTSVRLKAVEANTTGMVEIPAIGSSVLVGLVENDKDTLILLKTSEVDKVVFFGGNNNGMVLAGNIVDRINILEDAVKELIQANNTHTHLCTAPGTPSGNSTVVITTSITNTTISDVENIKIVQ